MKGARLLIALSLAAAGATHPARASAQGVLGADTLSARAVAESLSVLRSLDAAVREQRRDAAAWHRRGMLAWALAVRAKAKPAISGLDAARLARTADESLREAVQLAPETPRYRIALGQYLLTSGVAMTRASAAGHLNSALEAARRGGDPLVHSDAAIEVGRVHWRRYDSQANRRLITDTGVVRSIEEAVVRNPLVPFGGVDTRLTTENAVKRLHSILIDATQPLPGDVGMPEYSRAEALFREAYEAAPRYERAFRQLAMLLAEKDRWAELIQLARDHTAQAPGNAWGWFALGLALHRARESAAAKGAFEAALARLPPSERARLTGLQRVLRPADTATYLRAPDDARAASEQSFWLMADPLWSKPGNDTYTEFLARVAYAELRWTVEELGVRGADSDRGAIYIRFGPPDVIAKLSPRNREDDIANQSWESARVIDDLQAETSEVTFWDWYTGLVVVFWGAPGFGTARLAANDKQHVDYLVDLTPARWDNVATERILPMPVYIARFRAGGDSVDVLIATEPPVAEIRAAAAANSPVRASLWLFGRDVPDAYQDSLTLRSGTTARWVLRLPPSTYLYRIEAVADGALAAGSVSAWMTARTDSATGFTLRGFGMSDLLVGTRAGYASDARRWDDIEIAPMLAPIPRNSTLTVVWENYELGARDGTAEYEVAVTLQRDRSTTGRIAAEILGALAAAVAIDRRDDRLTMRFDRAVPHAPAFVDRLDLALGATPPGQYRLEIRVTDRVSGRTTARATGIAIR